MAHDFSKLKIPVNLVPLGDDVVDFFRELKAQEEFSSYSIKDRNKIVKYVIYAYDPKSPFVENSTSDLTKRKENAAEEAGFERNPTSGKFKQEVYDLIELFNEDANEMIFCYLRMINNRTWTLIVTNEQVFAEYTRLLMEPVAYSSYARKKATEGEDKQVEVKDDKKLLEAANVKAKLRDECKMIAADLDTLYKTLFGNNEDLKEKMAVRVIRPETMTVNV